MAREIRKKVIESEVPSGGDDPFEKMLEESMANDFDSPPPPRPVPSLDDDLGESPSFNGFDEVVVEEEEEAGRGFSLDDFDTDAPDPPPEEEVPAKTRKKPEEPSSAEEVHSKTRIRRRVALNKAAMVSVVAVLVLAAAVFGIRALLHEEPPPPRQVVTIIRHGIEIPVYQESLDFFVLAEAQDEKNILSMTIEFEFRNYTRLKNFRTDNVLVRDTVYQFLGSRHPARNSAKEWQKIVQKELPAHLEATLPQSLADSMRITRMERL